MGRIHEVSSIRQGSLRLSMIRDAMSSGKVRVRIMNRQGVTNGAERYALSSSTLPSLIQGVR